MEDFNNKLSVKLEDGTKATISIMDIIDSNVYGKTFIIYYVNGNTDSLFASILNENDTNFTLDAITNKEEIDYINKEIDRVVAEINKEE